MLSVDDTPVPGQKHLRNGNGHALPL